MNIFGKLLIKSEIVSNINGDTDKRLAGLKTNDITLTYVQEYDESNVVFAKFKINGDDGAEFGMTLRSKKNRLVNSLYALSAIRMADEFVEHDCWAVVNKVSHLAHHYLEAVKLPSYPTLLSRKGWMDSKVREGVFGYRKINCSGFGVTEEYYIDSHDELRKVHATEFDANQDLHRIVGHKTYNLYGIVDGEPKLLGTWYGANFICLCNELANTQPLEYPIIDRMPSHFEYKDHPLFFDMKHAKDYADDLKKIRHEVWGVKPLSKAPVLLGEYEATSFDAAVKLCPHVCYGLFNRFEYNGNPVFPSKYDAAQHIVERYDVKAEYAVYGYNPILKCAVYIGDGTGKTFDEAANRLFTNLNYQQPHIAAYRIELGIVGKWRYYGHPLFHTKEQAETYGKHQEALDSIIKSFGEIGSTIGKHRDVLDSIIKSFDEIGPTISIKDSGGIIAGGCTSQLMADVSNKRNPTKLVEIWGIDPKQERATLVAVYKTNAHEAYDSVIEHARMLKVIDCDGRYNGHPVFPTKESAENYLRKSGGILSGATTVTIKCDADTLNALKKYADAPQEVSIGYRTDKEDYLIDGAKIVGVDIAAHGGDTTVYGNASMFGDMSGFDKLPVQHLGFPDIITFVCAKKRPHKVQDLPYFSEVARAIGTTDAAMELFKVLQTTECHDDIMNEELDMAFTWNMTPQGDAFWAEVEARIQDQRAAEEQEILDESEDEGCKPQ